MRFYNSGIGAFLSIDPAYCAKSGFICSAANSPYSYAAASPITLSDPSGLLPESSEATRGSAGKSSISGGAGLGGSKTFYRGPSGAWYSDTNFQVGAIAYADVEWTILALAEEPVEGFYLAPVLALDGDVGIASAGAEVEVRFDNFHKDSNTGSRRRADIELGGSVSGSVGPVRASAGSDGLSGGAGGLWV